MPRVQVKHLSSRAALIQFTVPAKQRHGRGMRRRNITVPPRRGFFVDVKTLAAAMTGRSHSLASLGALLGTAQRKLATDGHGARLTQRYLDYAVADVATTWECYALLSAKYKSFGLSQTRENQIFSEAGIGKAHFREIGIVPWREVQSDFSPKVIGNIVSTYFGGRSDVNIRREVRQVLYCDFLSMYPTVCTLMGLWQFVIAKGIEYHDATDHVRTLLEHVTVAKCLGPEAWRDLAVIVQIKPNADPLPVRARYDANRGGYTIGLNDLTSDAEHWYTLADCIVASLLTGRPPKVIKALRLTPLPPQECLKPASIAGRGDYQVDPLTEDFYRRLIDLRTETKKNKSAAFELEEIAALESAQQFMKITANATSYGIFFELNVNDCTHKIEVQVHGADSEPFAAEVDSVEEPGTYFHPLLATLITGAARLMLALCERQVIEAGLDWVFCDTDSMAISKPQGMDEASFMDRARAVQISFTPLNPYRQKGPLLKIEDVNYDPAQPGRIVPLYAFAISPKRYVLFNLDRHGRPVIRKAMAHGLGHLLPPYDEDATYIDPGASVPWANTGVTRWQYDIWIEILKAALAGHPDAVRTAEMKGFDAPAASRYAATTTDLLNWFKSYNEGKPYAEQVKPFNFLLMYHVDGMACDIGRTPKHEFAEMPTAIASYSKDRRKAAKNCFDRRTGKPVPVKWLKSTGKALARYHMHPEAKYLGGDYCDRGHVHRRHIVVARIDHIGKEAHRWEEQLYLGEIPEAQIEYLREDKLLESVRAAAAEFSQREIAQESEIALRTVSAVLLRKQKPNRSTLLALARSIRVLESRRRDEIERVQAIRAKLQESIARTGLCETAEHLGIDPSNLRKMASGGRALPQDVKGRLLRTMCLGG
jgi:hypothetical protein